MEIVLALLGGVAVLLIVVAAVLLPSSRSRPRGGGSERSEQEQLRALREGPLSLAAPMVEGAVDRLMQGGRSQGLNDRYLRQLKQADWYWAPGEPSPPTEGAPFWNLETLWAAKVFHAALFGLGGLMLAGAAVAVFHWHPALMLVGLLAGAAGFFDPDSEVAEAAEKRRRQIVLEMGYKVPELRVYVRSGRTFVAALRYLTDRPGGPFVKEMHRVLAVYDVTADLERGLAAVMERNRLCEPLANLCGDLMAVLAEGGELGGVLDAHADAAQHEQRRQLRQQGQDNTQQMSYVVSGTTLLVLFLLIGGPALWVVVTSLGGM